MRRSAMRFRWFAILAALWGCAVTPGDQSASVCPPLEVYTPADNAAIARELDALPENDVLRRMADEDHELRVIMKACRQP